MLQFGAYPENGIRRPRTAPTNHALPCLMVPHQLGPASEALPTWAHAGSALLNHTAPPGIGRRCIGETVACLRVAPT